MGGIAKIGKRGSAELYSHMSGIARNMHQNPEFKAKVSAWRQRRQEECPPTKRFWPFVKKGGEDECWPWLKPQHNRACFYAHGRYWWPREYAYFDAYGHTEGKVHVGARCLNRCCNPAHLTIRPHGAISPRQEAQIERLELYAYMHMPEKIFWSRVDKGDQDGCWSWTADDPSFTVKGKSFVPRRYAWEITNGPIPKYHVLGSTCGDKLCVNPAHVVLVKGRGGNLKGPKRLTFHDAEYIRRLYEEKEMSQNAIARQFSIPQSHVSKIINLKAFKYPTADDPSFFLSDDEMAI